MDLSLLPHPAMPPRAVQSVNVQVDRDHRGLLLLYIVEGDPTRLKLPRLQEPGRADDLWQATCFELFVRDAGEAYREFNFSPSSQWSAYGFSAYRSGRRSLAQEEPPTVRLLSPEPRRTRLLASIDVEIAPNAGCGFSAVIEETDGTKSYWALAHPAAEPDFHHPDCFTLELPAAPSS